MVEVRPSQRFTDELRTCLGRLSSDGAPVQCGGARHRLVIDRHGTTACDHEAEAEAVLAAVGGEPPLCLRVAGALADATSPDLWSALAGERLSDRGEVLRHLPADDLALLVARSLHDEFEDASVVVRDSVSRLGLSLLAPGFEVTPATRTKFQMTRELPHWDPGPRRWTDKELVLLSRCMRVSKGDTTPHLQLLPADPVARRAVADYIVGLLDTHRLLSRDDLRRAIGPTFHNVRAVTALLLSERLLEESDGGFRVVARKRAGVAPARGRRRIRTI